MMLAHSVRPSRGIYTIPEMVERVSKVFAGKVALRIWRDGAYRECRYDELGEQVYVLAKGLTASGIQSGDRVGVLGENRPEWVLSYLAVLTCGAVVVPLDPLLKAGELRLILCDAEVRWVIASGGFVADLEEIRDELAGLERIVSMEAQGDGLYGLMEQGRASKVDLTRPGLDDLAALIYTSGTTGQAKGVMLTGRNIMSDVSGCYQVIEFGPEDTFLSVLPLHHTFECTAGFLVPLYGGASITYARSLKSRDILEDIKNTRVTVMLGVPLLFEKMLAAVYRGIAKKPPLTRSVFRALLGTVRGVRKASGWRWGAALFHGLREKAGLDSVRIMISGGAALPPHVGYDFNDLGLTLIQGYGLTEASPVLTVNPIERAKMASVGLPIPGVALRILDPDQDGVGQILARGDMVMRGYYRNPEATSEALQDGWLYTGDSGRMDEEGYLYITGRLKNVIVTRAGKNVYPEEVEQELNKSAFILESLVYGVPMADGGGEEVQAVIVPDYEYCDQYAQKRGTPLEEGEIEAILKREVATGCSNLADYKRVKGLQIREEEFPKTSTRKIKRFLFKHQPIAVQKHK